ISFPSFSYTLLLDSSDEEELFEKGTFIFYKKLK
ncbi:hypothetical protein EZS27_035728, partial [termite gut metagenome]